MTEPSLLSSSYSHYASRAYAAHDGLASRVAALAVAPISRERIDERLDALTNALRATPDSHLSEDALKKALRQLRAEVFCAVMERDLSGAADVAEVTGTMTDLAEATVQRAMAVVSADLEALYGEPRGSQGERLSLVPREFSLLQALIEEPARVFTRSELEDKLYGWGEEVGSNTIEVHVHSLRRKIGADQIVTVRGVGYRLKRAV